MNDVIKYNNKFVDVDFNPEFATYEVIAKLIVPNSKIKEIIDQFKETHILSKGLVNINHVYIEPEDKLLGYDSNNKFNFYFVVPKDSASNLLNLLEKPINKIGEIESKNLYSSALLIVEFDLSNEDYKKFMIDYESLLDIYKQDHKIKSESIYTKCIDDGNTKINLSVCCDAAVEKNIESLVKNYIIETLRIRE